jgi:hydrogenase maturation protease
MTIVVVGIGNEHRQDDGVGPVVASRVAELTPEVVDIGPGVDPLDLLGRWDGADLAVVVDAVRSGAPAGRVERLELTEESVPAHGLPDSQIITQTSTHGIGLGGVLRLAQTLGVAPKRVVVIGIEGRDFEWGLGLSQPVADAVPEAVRLALDAIGSL